MKNTRAHVRRYLNALGTFRKRKKDKDVEEIFFSTHEMVVKTARKFQIVHDVTFSSAIE